MSLVVIGFMLFLVVGFFAYGKYVSKKITFDDAKLTPAHTQFDGEDFVPTERFYLFGQHFSAIAAAGPIAGPITACLIWGWLPSLLWISIGVVFIGAVHDFMSLIVSVKNQAESIAEIARKQLSSKAGKLMGGFILIALFYIIVAFASITSESFVGKIDELDGVAVTFNSGGAVAASSVFYLCLSLVLGCVQKFLNPPLWLTTLIFVPLTFVAVWAGTYVSHLFVFPIEFWFVAICIYCLLATLCPVWLLLQPRGYLGGFVLYIVLALGVFGLVAGDYEILQPAFKTWNLETSPTGSMLPFLFVTIACGACSGFHGLVCSGTTSKQISKESHSHAIGYGAMLAEGLVAVLALGTVMILSPEQTANQKPATIYGQGIGSFLSLIIGREHLPFAITFGAMAFSTFVFDTLDVSTRLGRYLLQEILSLKSRMGLLVATIAMVAIPCGILLMGEKGSWVRYWTLFGASNQLLAALTLMVISAWYSQKAKTQSLGFLIVPMVFVYIITMSSLIVLIWQNFKHTNGFDDYAINAIAASALFVLAFLMAKLCFPFIRFRKSVL